MTGFQLTPAVAWLEQDYNHPTFWRDRLLQSRVHRQVVPRKMFEIMFDYHSGTSCSKCNPPGEEEAA